jgi:hypothetical protein
MEQNNANAIKDHVRKEYGRIGSSNSLGMKKNISSCCGNPGQTIGIIQK